MDAIAVAWRHLKRLGVRGLWVLFSIPAWAQTGTSIFYDGFENTSHYTETVGSFASDSAPGAAHSGSTAIKVVGSGAQQYMALSLVGVDPNGAYRVSLWVQSDLSSSAPAISVNALQLDAGYNAIGWHRNTFKLIKTGGRQKWTQYSATLSELDARTAFVKFYLRLDAGVSGPVWFDDVSVVSLNLLPDPGFEKAAWPESGGGGSTRSSSNRHGGSYSAQVVAGGTQRYIASARTPVTAAEAYDLSLWVSSSGFTRPEDVAINVLQVDKNDNALGWYRVNGDYMVVKAGASGSQGWTRKSIRLSNFAPNTAKLQIYLRTEAGRTGTAWLDDVVLARAYNDGFLWGVNDQAATSNHHVYDWSQLGARLDRVAMLGAGLYRVNLSPKFDLVTQKLIWSELDNVVEQAFQRRLKIYLVLFADGKTDISQPVHYREVARQVAAHYKGKIAYYQLGNEVDNECIIPGRSGEDRGDYDTAEDGKCSKYRTWLREVSTGIRQGDPYAKRAININWTHTAFLEMLNSDGLEWEVTGLDWYWGLGPVTSADPHPMKYVLDRLEKYPQPEVLITESNIFNGTMVSTEAQQADYIERAANEAYYRGGGTKLKGYLVYELLDRPRPLDQTDDSVAENQRHYGLIHYSAPPNGWTPGTIGTPKPAYDRYRLLINRKR